MNNELYHSNLIVNTGYDDELYHYGVPGMKWGKRKAVLPSSDSIMSRIKQQDKKVKASKASLKKQNLKALEKQYGALEDQMTYGKKADPKKNAKIEKQMASIEKQMKDIKSKSKQYKLDKKTAKQLKKDFIKSRTKEIRKGESIVAKLWGDITGARKYQAEIEYDARYTEDDD